MNRLWNAFKHKFIYALRGIYVTIKEEKSLWSHIIVLILVVSFGVWLKLNYIEWIIVSMNIALVIGFEIINTSIEALVDMISYQYNLKAKKIKDIAAGATLVISIESLIVGLVIFIPKLINVVS